MLVSSTSAGSSDMLPTGVPLPPDMPYAKREQAFGGHQAVVFRAHFRRQKIGVFRERVVLWNLQGCPEPVIAARRGGIR